MKVDYQIYPTLLDSFRWYKANPWDKKQELFNQINRVPFQTSDEQLRGKDFEAVVNATLDGEIIHHPYGNIVERVAIRLVNHHKQQDFISAILKVSGLRIFIYGYLDYSYSDKYVDLKTTNKYYKDKYKHNNQHGCYTLINKLNGGSATDFHYLVTDFKDVYTESYKCGDSEHQQFVHNLIEFTQFLEQHRHEITDNKIFGGK